MTNVTFNRQVKTMKRIDVALSLLSAVLLAGFASTPARAQLSGENLLGDMGTRSGTQPMPGFYASALYYFYNTNTIRDADGKRVMIAPGEPGSQTIQAVVPVFTYVSRLKVLGANYGAMAVMPFANGSVELPALGHAETASWGPSDLYLVPVQLGWHLARADFIASLGLLAPTGRYEAGASDNLGKGMWSYELAAGTTLYLDRERTLSIATTAFWEIHSKKEGEVTVGDVTVSDARVGQIATLEGGVAKTFASGAASVGVAYYAQWKLSDDDFGTDEPLPGDVGKHRIFGVGPDVTLPIAVRSRLIALVNARYMWETGARSRTEGNSLLITATFPVPGIPIGHAANQK
jgi:hypothetical protein